MPVNPLLTVSTLPNHAPPFETIKTEHYLPAVEAAIKEARTNVDAITGNKDAPTFDNTIVALEGASETLGNVTSVFYNMLSAFGGDDLQALVEKIGPIGSNFSSDLILDAKLFARIKSVYDAREKLKLSTEQMTLLTDTYRDFVRGGALLDDKKKHRLREINEQLSILGPGFVNNANKSAEAFEMVLDNKADLAGLPAIAIESAAAAAEEKGYTGKWLFTLDYPSYIPFVQYADNRDLREKMWRAFSSRGWGGQYDNSETILKIVTLKHESAGLLGYKTYADYVLERRMAEKPETVLAFIEKMKSTYKPAAQLELKALQDFAKERDNLTDLKPWDVGYYSEKLKEKLFDFSSEDFRPYFPLDTVLKGTFEHFSRLFHITLKQSDKYPVWHKDVKAFDVFDSDNNNFIGTFYTDFHPRTGKKSGAWMTSFREQGLYRGKIERPLIAIVCNFTKPTPDKPSLLTHDEVTTLFHEMGHAIHGLLSNVTYRALAGTSVLWDFVELPSQVQENWCYEKETLDLISGHYETDAKIPQELIEKLRASVNFMVAWGGLRQMAFSQLDMAWYTKNPADIKDVAAFEDEAVADAALFPRMAGPFSASFSHIFGGGYSAGYYSYKWAEVLDADTFELFKQRGLYDAKTAASYRTEILSKGGSEHPRILYQRFRGRDADPAALLRREGLLGDKSKVA